MSDAQLRALERAAQSGDPEAIERYLAEWLRAGRRDPRRDPRVGDVVHNASPSVSPIRRTRRVRGVYFLHEACCGIQTELRVDWCLHAPPVGDGRAPYGNASIGDWRRWAKGARVLRIAELPA